MIVFVYELSGCGFESSCSHFTFRFYEINSHYIWHFTQLEDLKNEICLRKKNEIISHCINEHSTI